MMALQNRERLTKVHLCFDNITLQFLTVQYAAAETKRVAAYYYRMRSTFFKWKSLLLAAMYVIKVKGIAKIPDYVQLRDDKFTLLAYFRVDRPEKSLEKLGLKEKQNDIMALIKDLPFGQIAELEI